MCAPATDSLTSPISHTAHTHTQQQQQRPADHHLQVEQRLVRARPALPVHGRESRVGRPGRSVSLKRGGRLVKRKQRVHARPRPTLLSTLHILTNDKHQQRKQTKTASRCASSRTQQSAPATATSSPARPTLSTAAPGRAPSAASTTTRSPASSRPSPACSPALGPRRRRGQSARRRGRRPTRASARPSMGALLSPASAAAARPS